MACLSPSIFAVFVKSQKVGRTVAHHVSRRNRGGQKEEVLSCLGCAR